MSKSVRQEKRVPIYLPKGWILRTPKMPRKLKALWSALNTPLNLRVEIGMPGKLKALWSAWKTPLNTWAGKMPEKLKHRLSACVETPAALTVSCCILFIVTAWILGDGWWDWAGFKAGIDPAWRIAVAFGGFYALTLAIQRTKAADEQASAAREQASIASRSNHAQRYEKASEMLWHREEAGMREAGCYALKSLGLDGDIGMAMQCRDLLVSFIQRSAPTLEQKESEPKQEGLSRSDIIAADHALSSLYRKWCDSKEFIRFRLNRIPSWFWGDIPAMWRPVSARDYPGANLSWANLSKANLSNANLSWAILRNADLRKVDLRKANLSWAILRKADLSWAILSEADFRGDGSEDQAAKGLTPEQIGSAVWGRTLGPPKLPDYLAVDANKMAEPLPEKH